MLADYLPILFGVLTALSLGVAVFVPSLKTPFLALLVLIVSLPFERVPSLEVAGMTLRFNQLAAVILIVTVTLSFVFGRRNVRPYPALLPILAFLLLVMWTAPYALNVVRAFSVFIFVVLMFLTSLAVSQVIVEKRQLTRLGTVFVLIGGFVALFGLFQFLGEMVGLPESVSLIKEGYTKEVFGFPRVHAFSHEPLYLANFLFLPLGVMLGLLVAGQDIMPRSWLWSILILTVIIFLLTLSRGAFIAAVPFVFMMAFFFFRRLLTWGNILAGLGGLVLAILIVWVILGAISPEARERFIGHATLQDVLVEQRGESAFGRLATFERAVELWRQAPLTGVGLGNYGPAVAYDPLVRPGYGWDIVNNQYLESLAETGVIGLVLLLIFWGMVAIRSFIAFYKTRDPLVKAFLGGLTAAYVAILVQYNFFSTLYIMHIWVLIGLLVAVQNIALIQVEGTKSLSVRRRPGRILSR
jgi:O-antigen ligase